MQRLLEAVPDAMVVIDTDGLVVMINSQFERLMGWTQAELLGRSIDIFVPEAHRAAHPGHRSEYLKDPTFRLMGADSDLYALRRDGTQFPAEINLASAQTDQGPLVTVAIRDVTARRRADELRFRLAAIVEGSDDAIISTTLTDIVTSWNHGAQTLFGYTEQEMMGRPLTVLLPPDRPGEDRQLLDELQREERIRHRDSLRRTKDGRDIVVSMTISPIRDQSGVLIGGSKVARDVTERTNSERALAEAKEGAETASREYEAFAYSVAHDLRAPLRALDGFSRKLIERHVDQLDEQGQDYLRRIGESAQYMAQLIDSLLRLARLSHRELVHEPVDLSALATETMDRLRTQTPLRKAEIVIQPGLTTRGDHGLLSIVFDNLLGNAWKFSRNEVSARIEFGQDATADGPVYFVRDNGAGFDMAHAAKLFGVFQRLHTVREFEGTGIGLVTVQRIISRHGGRVWAEGLPEHGASFFFTLDVKEK